MTLFGTADVVGKTFRKLRPHDMDAAMLTLSINYEVADRPLLQTAMGLASQAHRDQIRPGENGTAEPYITHPLRNTLRLIRFNCRDEEVLAAAVLHDTVEDQPVRLVELMDGDHSASPPAEATRLLAAHFNTTVSDTVWAVTNPPRPAGLSKEQKNTAYVEHVKAVIADPRAFLVKVTDFIDNAGSLSALTDLDKRNRLRAKYAPLVPIFQQMALSHGTELGLHPEGRERLTSCLDVLAESLREESESSQGSQSD
ncbi:HD domain-containing protein [Rhodococcus sp. PAMC28707]|uniref:HD domain-containing protein n=1 Tax=unclassified Rhodococcus (in: high G+C Gram-positive bacteria) TaxID=192944 RepID=UPI00109DB577|nr:MULTISPECIES: HD domain-containing protein [unclassified Rhodococcus (in: high G+C Gram-positive bacteria)]QCB52011.1 HD domain-containing protein [Rhodococcus sp. PAMC28705]QCB59821.1 HD domain-containing protein [Rhodococcus sp. PAMC28707]